MQGFTEFLIRWRMVHAKKSRCTLVGVDPSGALGLDRCTAMGVGIMREENRSMQHS